MRTTALKAIIEIFLAVASLAWVTGARATDDLSTILAEKQINLRVEKLVMYLERIDPKLAKSESAHAFETVDAQIEKEIRIYLGTEAEKDVSKLFPNYSDDDDEVDKNAREEARGAPSTEAGNLFTAYKLKSRLAKLKPYPHEARVAYDLGGLEPQMFRKIGLDFIRTFETFMSPLAESTWNELLARMKSVRTDRGLISAFYALVFLDEQAIPREALQTIHETFPLLDYANQTLARKCVLAGLIYEYSHKTKPALMQRLEVTEKQIQAYKKVREKSADIFKQTGARITDFLSMPSTLREKIDMVFILHGKMKSSLASDEQEWLSVSRELDAAINAKVGRLLSKGNTELAVGYSLLKWKLPNNEANAKAALQKLIQNPETSAVAVRNAPMAPYDTFYQDIIRAAQEDRALLPYVIDHLRIAPNSVPERIFVEVNTQPLVEAIIKILRNNEPAILMQNFKVIRKISEPAALKQNLAEFFEVILQKEPNTKLRLFIGGTDTELKSVLAEPGMGEILSVAVLKAFCDHPSDLAPDAFVEHLAGDKLLALKYQELIEKTGITMLVRYDYSVQGARTVGEGFPMLLARTLDRLAGLSAPERLVGNLLQVRKELKAQDKLAPNAKRQRVIHSIETKINFLLDTPLGRSCAFLLKNQNHN